MDAPRREPDHSRMRSLLSVLVAVMISLVGCDPPVAVQTVCERQSFGCSCTTYESTVGAPEGARCDTTVQPRCCLEAGGNINFCSCSSLTCNATERSVADCRVASAQAGGAQSTPRCNPFAGCGTGQACTYVATAQTEVCIPAGAGTTGSSCDFTLTQRSDCASRYFCASDRKCHVFCRTDAECGAGGRCSMVSGLPADAPGVCE